ncbi:DUF7344 domain-containing protein [Natrononativus amylolyticus]|uniref:DUF7344 domain-containing protein n=1 Tax=Natrononativus amylolyticus TaxID=2963434 RepID=UPI0020CFB944|nr:hypothetical protein [Natrononativus amylolyticus]
MKDPSEVVGRPSARTNASLTPFPVLAVPVRRHILEALVAADGALERDELARALAAEVADGPSRRERRVALTHVHLPALADAGLLEWDRRAATVVATERGRAVATGDGSADVTPAGGS